MVKHPSIKDVNSQGIQRLCTSKKDLNEFDEVCKEDSRGENSKLIIEAILKIKKKKERKINLEKLN